MFQEHVPVLRHRAVLMGLPGGAVRFDSRELVPPLTLRRQSGALPFGGCEDFLACRINGIARIDISDGCQQGTKTGCTCLVRRICIPGELDYP